MNMVWIRACIVSSFLHCYFFSIDCGRFNTYGTSKRGIAVLFAGEQTLQRFKDDEGTLIVVDEAILNLGGYSLSDPLSSFYHAKYCVMSSPHLWKHCLMLGAHLASILILFMGANLECLKCFGAMACKLAIDGDTIRTRSNFNPLVIWPDTASG